MDNSLSEAKAEPDFNRQSEKIGAKYIAEFAGRQDKPVIS